MDGSEFSGGLGFTRANWDEFNTFGYPADAADATPLEQIRVAVAFATAYWGNPDAAPDQDGCRRVLSSRPRTAGRTRRHPLVDTDPERMVGGEDERTDGQ